MLIYFWFFSFFPLILIPTEVVLKIKEGGAALTSSVTKMELQNLKSQSMYEDVDVPGFNSDENRMESNKKQQFIPDQHIAFQEEINNTQNGKNKEMILDSHNQDSSLQNISSDSSQEDSSELPKIKKEKIKSQSNSKIKAKHSDHQRNLEAQIYSESEIETTDLSSDPEHPPSSFEYSENFTPSDNSKEQGDWQGKNFIMYIMTHQNDHFLYELWLAYYFCTFLNGWFLLPLVIYYFLSGEFYFKTKLLDSVKYNLKYYFVMAIIMVIVLLILIFKGQNLKDVFRVSLSVYNSILYVVFLVSMSHGVARLPVKYLKTKTIRQTYIHQVNTFLRKKSKYSEYVLSMNKFYFILQALDEVTIDKYEREKRIMYEIFDQVKLVELDYNERLKLKENKHLKETNKALRNFVSLHYEIIKLNYQLQLHRAYVYEHLQKVLRLNRLSHRLFNSAIQFQDPEFKNLKVESLVRKPCVFRCLPSLEKPYYTRLRPCSQLSLCIFLSLSSLFVIFVETCGCFMEKQIVSVVRTIGNSVFGVILIVFFIAYLAFCAYYFFFRFNVFGVVGIKRRKKSNVYSLFYSTSMFVYLTYPICINVFHLFIGEKNTCFEQALGKQELASIGKISLFTLAPFIIMSVVLLTFFKVLGRLLQKIGIRVENDEETSLSEEDLEALQGKLNEEVIETLEDYNEYQHALIRLGRSQNLIDKFI